MEGHVPTPRLNPALFPSSSGNELASVNERKRFGRGAALDIDRFVLSAVDKDHLVRVQADPNARRCGHAGVGVRYFEDHHV